MSITAALGMIDQTAWSEVTPYALVGLFLMTLFLLLARGQLITKYQAEQQITIMRERLTDKDLVIRSALAEVLAMRSEVELQREANRDLRQLLGGGLEDVSAHVEEVAKILAMRRWDDPARRP